eukprot:6640820-Pyramimonas_sp.AAC.1
MAGNGLIRIPNEAIPGRSGNGNMPPIPRINRVALKTAWDMEMKLFMYILMVSHPRHTRGDGKGTHLTPVL